MVLLNVVLSVTHNKVQTKVAVMSIKLIGVIYIFCGKFCQFQLLKIFCSSVSDRIYVS